MQYENLTLELKENTIHMRFEGQAPLFWKHACQYLLLMVSGMPGEDSVALEKLSRKVGMTAAKFSVFKITLARPADFKVDATLEAFLEILPLLRRIAYIKGGVYAV